MTKQKKTLMNENDNKLMEYCQQLLTTPKNPSKEKLQQLVERLQTDEGYSKFGKIYQQLLTHKDLAETFLLTPELLFTLSVQHHGRKKANRENRVISAWKAYYDQLEEAMKTDLLSHSSPVIIELATHLLATFSTEPQKIAVILNTLLEKKYIKTYPSLQQFADILKKTIESIKLEATNKRDPLPSSQVTHDDTHTTQRITQQFLTIKNEKKPEEYETWVIQQIEKIIAATLSDPSTLQHCTDVLIDLITDKSIPEELSTLTMEALKNQLASHVNLAVAFFSSLIDLKIDDIKNTALSLHLFLPYQWNDLILTRKWEQVILAKLTETAHFTANVLSQQADLSSDSIIFLNKQTPEFRLIFLIRFFENTKEASNENKALAALFSIKITDIQGEGTLTLLSLILMQINQDKAIAKGSDWTKLKLDLLEKMLTISHSNNDISVLKDGLRKWPQLENEILEHLKKPLSSEPDALSRVAASISRKNLLTLLSSDKQKEIIQHWLEIKASEESLRSWINLFPLYADRITLVSSSNINPQNKTDLQKILFQDSTWYTPHALTDEQLRKLFTLDTLSNTVTIQRMLETEHDSAKKELIYLRILEMTATALAESAAAAMAYMAPILNNSALAWSILQKTDPTIKDRLNVCLNNVSATPAGKTAIRHHFSQAILATDQNLLTLPKESCARVYIASLDFWLSYFDKTIKDEYISGSYLSKLKTLIKQLDADEAKNLLQEATKKIDDLTNLNPAHREDIILAYAEVIKKQTGSSNLPELLNLFCSILAKFYLNDHSLFSLPKLLDFLSQKIGFNIALQKNIIQTLMNDKKIATSLPESTSKNTSDTTIKITSFSGSYFILWFSALPNTERNAIFNDTKNNGLLPWILSLASNDAHILTLLDFATDEQKIAILEKPGVMEKMSVQAVETILNIIQDESKKAQFCKGILLDATFNSHKNLKKHEFSLSQYLPLEECEKCFDTAASVDLSTKNSYSQNELENIQRWGMMLLTRKEGIDSLMSPLWGTHSGLDLRLDKFKSVMIGDGKTNANNPFWFTAEMSNKISEQSLKAIFDNLLSFEEKQFIENVFTVGNIFQAINDSEGSYATHPKEKMLLLKALIEYLSERLAVQNDTATHMPLTAIQILQIQADINTAWENLIENLNLSSEKDSSNQASNKPWQSFTQEQQLSLLHLLDKKTAAIIDLRETTLAEFHQVDSVLREKEIVIEKTTGSTVSQTERQQLLKVSPEMAKYQKNINHRQKDLALFKSLAPLYINCFESTFNLESLPLLSSHEGAAYWKLCQENLLMFSAVVVENASVVETPIHHLTQMLLHESNDINRADKWKAFQTFFESLQQKESEVDGFCLVGLVDGLHNALINNDHIIDIKKINAIPLESLDWLVHQIANDKDINENVMSALMHRYTMAVLSGKIELKSDDAIFNRINQQTPIKAKIIRQGIHQAIGENGQEIQQHSEKLPANLRAFFLNYSNQDGVLNNNNTIVAVLATLLQLPESLYHDEQVQTIKKATGKIRQNLLKQPIDDWAKKIEQALIGLNAENHPSILPLFQALLKYYADTLNASQKDLTDDSNIIFDRFAEITDKIAVYFGVSIDVLLTQCNPELKSSLLKEAFSGLKATRIVNIQAACNSSNDIKNYREAFFGKTALTIPDDRRSLSYADGDMWHVFPIQDTHEWGIIGRCANNIPPHDPAVIEFFASCSNDSTLTVKIWDNSKQDYIAYSSEKTVEPDWKTALGKDITHCLQIIVEKIKTADFNEDNNIAINQLKSIKELILKSPSPSENRQQRSKRLLSQWLKSAIDSPENDAFKKEALDTLIQRNELNGINAHFTAFHQATLGAITGKSSGPFDIEKLNTMPELEKLQRLQEEYVVLRNWLTSPENVATLDDPHLTIQFTDCINSLRERIPVFLKIAKDTYEKTKKEIDAKIQPLEKTNPSDDETKKSDLIAQKQELEWKIQRTKNFSADDYLIIVVNRLRENIAAITHNPSSTIEQRKFAERANHVISHYLQGEFQEQYAAKTITQWVTRGLENTVRKMIGGDVDQCESVLSRFLSKQRFNVAKAWKKEAADLNRESVYIRRHGKLIEVAKVPAKISSINENSRQYSLTWNEAYKTTEQASLYYQALNQYDALIEKRTHIQQLVEQYKAKNIEPYESLYGHLPTALQKIEVEIAEKQALILSGQPDPAQMTLTLSAGETLYKHNGQVLGLLNQTLCLEHDLLYGEHTWLDILLNEPLEELKASNDATNIALLDVIHQGLLPELLKTIHRSDTIEKDKAAFLQIRLQYVLLNTAPFLSKETCIELVKDYSTEALLQFFNAYNNDNDQGGHTRQALLEAILSSPKHMPYFLAYEKIQITLFHDLTLCDFKENELRLLLTHFTTPEILTEKNPLNPHANQLGQIVRAAYLTLFYPNVAKTEGLHSSKAMNQFHIHQLPTAIIQEIPKETRKAVFNVFDNFSALTQKNIFNALSHDFNLDELKALFQHFLTHGFEHSKLDTGKGLVAFYQKLGDRVFWTEFNKQFPPENNNTKRQQWISQGMFGNTAFMQIVSEGLWDDSSIKLAARDTSQFLRSAGEQLGLLEKLSDRYASFTMDEMIDLVNYYCEHPSENLQVFLADWLFLQLESEQFILAGQNNISDYSDADRTFLDALTWDENGDIQLPVLNDLADATRLSPQTTATKGITQLNNTHIEALEKLIGNKAFRGMMTSKYALTKSNLEKLVETKAQRETGNFSAFYDHYQQINTEKFSLEAAQTTISLSIGGSWNNRAWMPVKAIDYALLESARMAETSEPKNPMQRKNWRKLLSDYIGSIGNTLDKAITIHEADKEKPLSLDAVHNQLTQVRQTILRLLSSGSITPTAVEDTLHVLLERRHFLRLMDLYQTNKDNKDPIAQKIKNEIQAIISAMFIASPTLFLSGLAAFDRNQEWKFAVEECLQLSDTLNGKTDSTLEKELSEARFTRRKAILAGTISTTLAAAGTGYMMNATKKAALAGLAVGVAGGIALEVSGQASAAAQKGYKTVKDAFTAACQGIELEELNNARCIAQDRDFEIQEQCKKRRRTVPGAALSKSGFVSGWRRLKQYRPDLGWFRRPIYTVGLYLGIVAEPKSDFGLASYRQNIPDIYIKTVDETHKHSIPNTIVLTATPVNQSSQYECRFYNDKGHCIHEKLVHAVDLSNYQNLMLNKTKLSAQKIPKDQRENFGDLLTTIESARNKAILEADSIHRRAYYDTTRTLIQEGHTGKASVKAIEADSKEFLQFKTHLAITPPVKTENSEDDKRVNVTQAEANEADLRIALNLINLTQGERKAAAGSKNSFSLSQGFLSGIYNTLTKWYTGNHLLEKEGIQALKARLNELLYHSSNPLPLNNIHHNIADNIISSRLINSHADSLIKSLTTIIHEQHLITQNLIKTVEKNIANNHDITAILPELERRLAGFIKTATRLRCLGEKEDNKSIQQVTEYCKALQKLIDDNKIQKPVIAQILQNMATNIQYDCSHTAKRLLISRLSHVEKALIASAPSTPCTIYQAKLNTNRKEQWDACKNILRDYPEDKNIHEQFMTLSTQLNLSVTNIYHEATHPSDLGHSASAAFGYKWGLTSNGRKSNSKEIYTTILQD